MRLFVSIDLEGCTGVFAEQQTVPGQGLYDEARALMRADLDAVLAGCLAAGADEVVVCDAHDEGANVPLDDLPDGVRLVRGSPEPLGMMAGIDQGTFDAALFVGYHGRAGTTAAVLDHTYTYKVFRVRVDDVLDAGEFAINAGLAGRFGVPVVFVSGDDKAIAEAAELVPSVTGVVVKEGLARVAARLVAPEVTERLLREGAEAAVRASAAQPPAPLDWAESSLRVVFIRSDYCDAAAGCPGVERVDARTIRIEHPDFFDTFRAFVASLRIAATVDRVPS